MRALRVVGLTEDGDVVLEDPVRLERYTVPADERLRAAARGDLSRLGQIAIELESQLRPREIQARIRAGASVEQVATAAGVPEQKIERFAYPVLTRALPDGGQRSTRPPDARRRPGQPHAGRGDRAHVRAARPGIRRGEVGFVEGRGRPLGGRAELAGGAFGQPCALGVPAGCARRHRDRARRARERPGRGPAGPAAAHRRCRGRHDPSGGGAPARSLAGGAVAGGGVRQLPRPHTDAHGRRRRAPAEPWRPAPPAQRQAEPPADPRQVERRTVEQRGSEQRPRSVRRAATGRAPCGAAAGRLPAGSPRPAGGGTAGAGTTSEWAPWERGVNRTAVPPLPAPPAFSAPAQDGDVTVPAARTAVPVKPGDEKPAAATAPGLPRPRSSARPRSRPRRLQ